MLSIRNRIRDVYIILIKVPYVKYLKYIEYD